MPSTRIPWIVAAFASFLICASGQASPAPTGPKVYIPFFANDGHDKPILDVTQADVAILDNKKPPQSVLGMRTAAELPLRLGVLINTSGSERLSGLYQIEVEAASEFLTRVLNGTEDRAFVENFGAVPHATQFLTKAELRAVKLDVTPAGPSAFYDAIRFACEERMEKDPLHAARRIIVLVGDGHDNASQIDQGKAIASAQEAGAVVFLVSTLDDPRAPSQRRNGALKEFADQTGGAVFLQLTRKDIPNVFATIREQIDNMRVLSYVPAGPLQDGQRRPIELKPASSRKLKIRAPKAYYLTATTQ
jgi:VWFA-related protein